MEKVKINYSKMESTILLIKPVQTIFIIRTSNFDLSNINIQNSLFNYNEI